MPRFKYSLLAALGLALLAGVISLVGPKRALAALGYTPVRDVDNAARQPFQTQVDADIPDGVFTGSASLSPVPAGKRLVVETLSVLRLGVSQPGQSVQVEVQTTVNGQPGSYVLPYVATTGAPNPGISQSLRFYVDPGTTVGVLPHRTGSVGTETDRVTLSGYLVNLP